MWGGACPYCTGTQGRCTSTPSGRSVTECSSCGRIIEERQTQPHTLFNLRAQDTPLCLVTSDLSSTIPSPSLVPLPPEQQDDPFHPTGFITAFSTWSLEPSPIFALSSLSFSGQLAELERSLESSSSASTGPVVVVDNLRAYLQIVDMASLLDLDSDISDHAFQLFRDCSSATCLRNRSVEALATAALVQAIREAQEPRTLQEISIAANLPQKEIGKYIKILGEALQLSQPINSNSIAVHMPRFCTLLHLNKSAQKLATHIGEVVINKCFCTRRNPISISAAAIYLACQLEDKRKTQAEICKVTGLTEVTLRKVYKELLENWDDLLPTNYTPAVPPEKAFPTTAITSGRSAPRIDPSEITNTIDKDKLTEVLVTDNLAKGKLDATEKGKSFWQRPHSFAVQSSRHVHGEKNQSKPRDIDINETQLTPSELMESITRDPKATNSSQKQPTQLSGTSVTNGGSKTWPFHAKHTSGASHAQFAQPSKISDPSEHKVGESENRSEEADHLGVQRSHELPGL